jgi:hypothetical protein
MKTILHTFDGMIIEICSISRLSMRLVTEISESNSKVDTIQI